MNERSIFPQRLGDVNADFRFAILSGQNYKPKSPPLLIFVHLLILAAADCAEGVYARTITTCSIYEPLTVNNDLTIIGSPGKLTVRPKHKINPAYLCYHQTLYSGVLNLKALFSKTRSAH